LDESDRDPWAGSEKPKAVRPRAGEKDAEARYSLPNLYVEGGTKWAKAFNCVQRSHQQAFETLPQLLRGIDLNPRFAQPRFGRAGVLDLTPEGIHQSVGLMFGSRQEVERIEQYHRQPKAQDEGLQLFTERSLFRD
jgi:hypothetical protein